MTTVIRLKTNAHYRGLEVTILGTVRAGALAIAGYGASQQLAIATIAVRRRRGQRIYSVAGTNEWTTSLETVARAAVKAREARDARARLAPRTTLPWRRGRPGVSA